MPGRSRTYRHGGGELLEILTKNQKLTESLRLPASTRMQKIHNVGVALKALENSAAGAPPENPTPKDIVDGHLQKTLDLLWHVIFGFQIGQLLSIEHLSNEISYLEKTLNHEVRIGNKKAQLGWNFYLDCKRRKLKDESDNDRVLYGDDEDDDDDERRK